MFEFISFGSSSQGNCSLIRTEQTAILIDAGLSAKRILENLEKIGLEPEKLSALLLTHAHSDHTKGLFNLLKKIPGLPVFMSKTSHYLLREKGPLNCDNIRYFPEIIRIDEMLISVHAVPHMGVHPECKDDPGTTVGFIIKYQEKKLAYFTDLGEVPIPLIKKMNNCDLYFIEANHDIMWQKACKNRPQYVVERNLSAFGHLSNDQTAQLLLELIKPGKRSKVMLAHISKDCNSEVKALDTIEKVLKKKDLLEYVELSAAPLREASELISV